MSGPEDKRANPRLLRACSLLAAFAVALATGLFGLERPFHIDDPAYLAVARTILQTPLEPLGGAVGLDARDLDVFRARGETPRTFTAMSHPPFVPYLLALCGLLAGGLREVPSHLAFLIFPLLALTAQWRLARRFSSDCGTAVLLFATSPIFVVCGQGLMTDLPALALTLAGLALFVTAVDKERSGLATAAGLCLGLGLVTRYASLAVLPLWPLYALPRRRSRELCASLAGAAAVASLWALQNWTYHGGLHLLASSGHYASYYGGASAFGLAALGERAGADLAGLGGTALFLPLLLLAQDRARRNVVTLAVGLGLGAAIVAINPFALEMGRLQLRIALAVALGIGLGLLAAAGAAATAATGSRVDGRFLLVWLVLSVAGGIALLPFGTARYMLPALPPLLLLLCRSDPARGRRALRHVALGASLLLALALARADAAYAGAYRDFARQLSFPAGQHVYFLGDWGFRWYMQERGGLYLGPGDERPKTGDLIVRPRVAANHDLSDALKRRAVLVASHEAKDSFPVRSMAREAGAGFYSHGWGYLPFGWSRDALETFDVYRVTSASASDGAPAAER